MDPSETITSPSNPRVKQAARLRDAGERRRTGLTLVDGIRELTRAAASGVEIVDVFVASGIADRSPERSAEQTECLDACRARGGAIVSLGPRAFEKVAFGDRNEGVVGVVRFSGQPLQDGMFTAGRPVLVAESVEKPGNLGGILRTADASGLGGVIVCDPRTDVANPAVVRASLGTVFRVPLAVTTTAEAIRWAGASGRRIVAAMPTGSRLWHDVDLTGNTLLVVGSEAEGLSSAWLDAASTGTISLETIHLPMRGIADSLNVSVTAAVIAYEALRQKGTR